MKSIVANINWDKIGISASLACAIHCAALPVILTISSLSSLAWLETPAIEITFLLVSFFVASFSLTRGFVHHHHIFKAIKIVSFGFALMIASRFFEHGNLHHIITAIGGFIVAYAHYVNFKLTKNCESCEHH